MKKGIILIMFLFTFVLLFFLVLNTYLNNTSKIAVLCYHNIALDREKSNFPDEADWTITIDNFREHLDFLKKHNYKTLTMDEFYNWKIGKLTLPYKSVLITFDDGFLSNYIYAFPLLREYNMNATVFTVGSFVENSFEENWTGNIKTYMTKNILENLNTSFPNIEIYSHSYNLHFEGAIEQSENILIDDIKKFDSFYKKTDIFCYPFGQFNDNIKNALKKCNYKLAFKYGPKKSDYKKASLSDNIYEIPRLNVSHGMNKLKFGLRLLWLF